MAGELFDTDAGPVRLAPVADVEAFADGWQESFGRPLGRERDWLLRRDTALIGAVTQSGRLVGGLGLRRLRVKHESGISEVRVVHDAWVVPDFQRFGIFTALAADAGSRSALLGAAATVGFIHRKRHSGPGMLTAGYRRHQGTSVLVGPASGLAARSATIRMGGRIGEFGLVAVAELIQGSTPPDFAVATVRDAHYLRGRFDESPRAYLVAAQVDRTGQPIGVAIAKIWPRKHSGQVLLLAATDSAVAERLLRAVAHRTEAELAGARLAVSEPAGTMVADLLADSGFVREDGGHDMMLLTDSSALARPWGLCQDEINSF